jgi:hypothetical protein
LFSKLGPITKPSTSFEWAATSVCWNMMMKGESRWCSRWMAWYISARFFASRSSTAA